MSRFVSKGWYQLPALLCLLTAAPIAGLQEQAAEDPPKGEQSEDERPAFIEEIEVRERSDVMVGIAVSASEGSTGIADLERRPILRPGDVVETVPGMVATQHSGGGKANQFFVRGFNLDHGTDFAVSVDGVPVNMPTHGHGQGYADLNFLIPEIVERARFRKGPYWARVGDFSSAGSLEIDVIRRLPQRKVVLTAGNFDYGRALFAQSFRLGEKAPGADSSGSDLLVALETFHEDGPWTRGDDYDGGKAVVKWSTGSSARGFSLTGLGYSAAWLATDQIPQRAVDSGQVGRFDLLTDGPRGDTKRFSLAAEGHRTEGRVADRFNVWAMSYDFSLVGNFTYFLADPDNGDEVTQLDDRTAFGGEITRSWFVPWASRTVEFTTGAQMRYDLINNGLLLSQSAIPRQTARQDEIELFGGGVFGEARVRLTDWMRGSLGLRLQVYDADVESLLVVNSGSISDELLSPKLSLAFGPWRDTEIYVNYGRGMHSNDARGAVIQVDPLTGDPAGTSPPLVETEGFDIGFRSTPWANFQTTVTLFQLDLESELIFVGDAGVTEAGRPSRREGVEWTNHYEPNDAWAFDLDLTLADAEFRDDDPAGNQVPGSVGTTVAAGISWQDEGPWRAALRWRYFGDVPLIEDGSEEWSSSQTLNGRLGYDFGSVALSLDVFNLLGREQDDIRYFYASRLPGEPADGVEDVHFHPSTRRAARLALTWSY